MQFKTTAKEMDCQEDWLFTIFMVKYHTLWECNYSNVYDCTHSHLSFQIVVVKISLQFHEYVCIRLIAVDHLCNSKCMLCLLTYRDVKHGNISFGFKESSESFCKFSIGETKCCNPISYICSPMCKLESTCKGIWRPKQKANLQHWEEGILFLLSKKIDTYKYGTYSCHICLGLPELT